MAIRNSIFVPANHFLTVVADSVSDGRIFEIHSGSNSSDIETVSAGSTVVVEPEGNSRDYMIVSENGLLVATVSAGYDLIDDDTLATADSDNIASAESMKAYVDTVAAGIEVGGLTDVEITTPTAGQVIIYDATDEQFENATLTAGSNIAITEGDASISIAVTGLDSYELKSANVLRVGTTREYTTIQAALTAIGDATSEAENKIPYAVVVDGGTYDEDLTIPDGRLITLLANGTVVLGDGLGANWSSTNSRSITVNTDSTKIFGDFGRPALMMGVAVPADSTSTFLAMASGWRISGGLTISGDATRSVVLEAVEFAGAVTHSSIGFTNLLARRCLFKDVINETAGVLHLARLEHCQFDALITATGYNEIVNSEIKAGMTISAALDTLPPSCMFGTKFTGVFTGVANSFKIDAVTNQYFIANGGSLAGTATKVVLEALPADKAVYDNSTSGLSATEVQSAIDEVEGRVDTLESSSHAAITLNADDATQETLNLSGQEVQVNLATSTTDGAMAATDKDKLDGIESSADVTDEANVTDALDGATLVAATVDAADKVLIQDSDDSDILKTATVQSIADLASISVGGLANVDVTQGSGQEAGNVLIYNATSTNWENAFLTSAGNVTFTPGDASIQIDVHDAVSLNADDATQETLNLAGQEIQVNLATSTTDGAMAAADKDKLDNIEASADVTDETNVLSSLNGATISSTTVAGTDKVIVQDADDSDNIKTVTAQSIADLAGDLDNPMTTAGDIIKGGTSGAAERLAIGTEAQVLTVSSGAPVWADASGGSSAAAVKNVIVGGDFDTNPWQRGTSFVSPANSSPLADCWKGTEIGFTAFAATQQADAPAFFQSNTISTKCLQVAATTADPSPDTAHLVGVRNQVEGSRFAALAQKAMTLSFWVKCSIRGTFCVALSNAGSDRSFVSEYTINSDNTWEKKTINIPASPSAGTWDYTNGVGITVFFTLMSGTSRNTTPDIWQTGSYSGTSNQTNFMAATSRFWKVALVQLESGSTASDFDKRSAAEELALCQRYFQKSYNQGVAPGTVSAVGQKFCINSVSASGLYMMASTLPVTMRTTPTVTWYSPSSGDSGKVYNLNGTADVAVASTSNPGDATSGSPILTASLADQVVSQGHWTASAEL